VLAQALIVLCLAGAPALAQEAPPSADGAEDEDSAAAASPEGEIRVDPVTGRRYRDVRPDDALRRGAWPVDRWVPLVAGVLVALGALVALALAHRKRGLRKSRGK